MQRDGGLSQRAFPSAPFSPFISPFIHLKFPSISANESRTIKKNVSIKRNEYKVFMPIFHYLRYFGDLYACQHKITFGLGRDNLFCVWDKFHETWYCDLNYLSYNSCAENLTTQWDFILNILIVLTYKTSSRCTVQRSEYYWWVLVQRPYILVLFTKTSYTLDKSFDIKSWIEYTTRFIHMLAKIHIICNFELKSSIYKYKPQSIYS